MKAFVWTMAIYFGLDAFAYLLCLANGVTPTRTPSGMLGAAMIGIGFMVWAIVLIP